MNKLTKLKIINISLSVIALISIVFNLYFITKNKELNKQEIENQTLNNDEIIVEEKKDNEISEQENIKKEVTVTEKEEPEKEYIYKYIEGKEKQVIVEKEVEKTIEVPASSTDATVTYTDASGNSKSINLPSGTTINFSAGEHGTYDSVPASITLTDNQEVDITGSSYNPSSVEVNYIFKGFSYSGNTMKCEYVLANNTVNVECRHIKNTIKDHGVLYIQLDYLETTGTQYINTGISFNNWNTKYELDVHILEGASQNGNDGYIIGSLNDGTGYLFRLGAGGSVVNITKTLARATLVLDGANNKIYIDGTSYNITRGSGTNNLDIGLGYRISADTQIYTKEKIYGAKIWQNGALVIDLIPVERISDGVSGMLDVVSGNFLTNVGSGVFNHPDTIDIPARYAGRVIASGTYVSDSSLTLTAVPNDGYVFVKWSDGVTSATRPITVENSTVYTALFAPDN